LIGTWKAADWAIRFYEKHGFRLVEEEEKNRLLKKYWAIPDRQVETSVVLVDGKYKGSIEMPSEYGKFETKAAALKIRQAGSGDIDAIVRIYVDSWNAGFGPLMPAIEADAARISRWRKELAESSATRWWLAERGDDIVGFVGIGPSRNPIDSDLGELNTIAVDPRAWRTGVGKALMSVALEGLRSDGYYSAVLWTLSDYPQAESFYVSTGWRLSGATRRDGQQVRYDHEL
jgi:N-acetylglutamate synthase-like GNAT family acetyltransferase